MESGPPKIIEMIAAVLIPPACREEVRGDLRERSEGAFEFAIDAARTIPCVIYSRVRRTTDLVLAFAQALSLYVCYTMAALAFDRPLLMAQDSFTRLAIPPATILSVIILADAYSNPKRRWPLKPLFAPILGIAIAFAVELRLQDWALPPVVLSWGSGFAALLASSLRLVFPPLADRPQTIHAAAHWQKMELPPFTFRYKYELLAALIVLMIVLHMLVK